MVGALHVQGGSAAQQAAAADAALSAAVGAATSPQLSGALGRLAGRFRGRSDDVGVRMTSLAASLTTAHDAITATDGTLAADASGMGR
ncbi:hypothetical protein BIU98_08420 [Curtobacterium sp. MMLR14_010]|nr:hypothetical protein BIU98_08420 [Curtobacterium sp. MMLR14_010]